MRKTFFCLLLLPAFIIFKPSTTFAQSNLTVLVNVIETLQCLKDIKANKAELEKAGADIKANHANNDSVITLFRQKYSLVKVAADNILNSIIIDVTDKDKRKIFADRPSLVADYYNEPVSIYNMAVKDFNTNYAKLKGVKGIFDFLKDAAKLLFSEILNAAKRIAIEKLIEKIRTPYQMKDWSAL
jgi:hypothetical protein